MPDFKIHIRLYNLDLNSVSFIFIKANVNVKYFFVMPYLRSYAREIDVIILCNI